jgi:hypothetical protein
MPRDETMDEITKHDPDAGLEPTFTAPANACDAHFHAFGVADKYPCGSDIKRANPRRPARRFTLVDTCIRR